MLTKSKVSIYTDVVFVGAQEFSIGDGIIESIPAHWCVVFTHQITGEWNLWLPYERWYTFVAKPTRKQTSKARKQFKICYDIFEHYN